MLNLNLNTTLSGQGGNPSLGPDPASITYYYTSSVWNEPPNLEERLVITISGSEEISRQPWNRQFVATGGEEESKTYPAQSGSSVNVKLIAETPFNTDDETYINFDYILVGGGSGGGNSMGGGFQCLRGGRGGAGGFVLTGSFQLAYGYSEVTASLTIAQIGFNEVSNTTSSIIDTTFIAEGNESYTISGSINVIQFTDYFSSASLIGSGGLGSSANPKAGQDSVVFGNNLGNQFLTSSILNSAMGIRYATEGGIAGDCLTGGNRTPGSDGLTWLNGVVYGSSGGAGATTLSSTVSNGLAPGANAGGGGSNAPANFGGGGGGFSAVTTVIGNGGSGVYIIRYYDPNDEYTATGGVKTKIGDFVYHQFNTAGVFNFTIPATNPYL